MTPWKTTAGCFRNEPAGTVLCLLHKGFVSIISIYTRTIVHKSFF